jgi:S1-C subfamily serine protease
MEDARGQPVSLGSGFFVRTGTIASNLHVVEGALRGYAKIVGQKTKHDIEGITATDTERDLVLLKISETRTPALSLGNSDSVEVGEPVYAMRNLQGLEGTFSQGIVSSIRAVGLDKLLQITAPISPGSSGGPVLNRKVTLSVFRSLHLEGAKI